MYRNVALCLGVVLMSAVLALAQDGAETRAAAGPATAVETAQPAKAGEQVKAGEQAKDGEAAKAKTGAADAKELSGMSIVGNDEAPKSLYIVPWKSSEIGVETSLNIKFDEGDVPVDRDVFMRQLEFYRISTAKQ